jgi:hypothetical protein
MGDEEAGAHRSLDYLTPFEYAQQRQSSVISVTQSAT